MPVADQTQSSVSLVFKFDPFRLAELHRNCIRDAFESLQPGHLINTHRVRIRLKIQAVSFPPGLTDSVVFLSCVQPVLASNQYLFPSFNDSSQDANLDKLKGILLAFQAV